ncbi:MAG: hypothetical protein IT289_07495 [Oligoflexia bacterium]|nr:hypothetical protein [Oligoflexia bacterium]
MANHSGRIFKKLSDQYKTPEAVQWYIRTFKYNRERNKITSRSALSTYRAKSAHCIEAALLAAAILEQRGYPPLLLSLESEDMLDHVLFLFKENNLWGTIGTSRCPGLKGRAPVFKTIRSLVLSYADAFVDETARLKSYAIVDLRSLKGSWRDSTRNTWYLVNYLVKLKHKRIKTSERRYLSALRRFQKFGEGGIPDSTWW